MVSMSTDAGGYQPAGPPPPGYPPPGYYPPQGYPAPGYQGYPPPGYPGYPPPGYPPPPGYGAPPPGYAPPGGYPPPGYPPPGYAPYGYPPGYGPPPVAQVIKPGVIPLRPLSLSDIFNGAVAYIRANPKATLGLTTIVVVAAQVLALVLSVGPLAVTGELTSTLTGGDEVPTGVLVGSTVSSLAGAGATWLSGILLTGMLTVVVGRAVFGASITIGEAWQRLRPRLWALIGFAVLEGFGAMLLGAIGFGIALGVGFAFNEVAGLIVGIPLGLAVIALLVYLGTMLAFTPSIIVLERLAILPAISRSFKLVRNDFWRVFGIWLLGQIVAGLVAGAVAVPFSFGGQILLMTASSTVATLIALVLLSVGSAIGQIITAPFSAGVVVLLYTDRRIRAEALDLVLQTGAAFGPGAPADSTDHLWLTRQS
jgi:hypothetical protein